MSHYCKADAAVASFVEDVMHQFHKDLVNADVTVEVLFAHADGECPGPPVTHNGYQALAVLKVNSQKDRVAGLADARIVVDGDGWEEWSEERRRAVIDHELYHLLLKLNKFGMVKTDDCHRPKLELRKHDWQLGGFEAIVRRHGVEAVEAQGLALAKRRLEQMEFDWDAAETAAMGVQGMAATTAV